MYQTSSLINRRPKGLRVTRHPRNLFSRVQLFFGVLGVGDIGGLRSVGPEIFSDEYDALPPEESGRRAGGQHGISCQTFLRRRCTLRIRLGT